MADGGYCDYPGQMDGGVLQAIANYSHRQNHESFENKVGPGFYTEHHFPPEISNGNGSMEQMNSGIDMSSSSDMSVMCGMNLPTTRSGQGPNVFDVMHGFQVKQEKSRMPPTPPGSPDDPKDMQENGMSNMNADLMGDIHNQAMAAMHQQFLAKPVPMRRLSEKPIAQARACLTSVPGSSTTIPETPIDTTAGMSMYPGTNPALARALMATQVSQKRPRSEKKAIPDQMKDDKYFERRKRNNSAAKKSRDARKSREDEIAIRASFLEKENAILRAQVSTLREEANSLRQLLLQKRSHP